MLFYARKMFQLSVHQQHVSLGMRVRKVSNSKSVLQGHWHWCHSI